MFSDVYREFSHELLLNIWKYIIFAILLLLFLICELELMCGLIQLETRRLSDSQIATYRLVGLQLTTRKLLGLQSTEFTIPES